MKAKMVEDDAMAKVHRIRITLTSRNVQNLEKGACSRSRHAVARPATKSTRHLPFGEHHSVSAATPSAPLSLFQK